MCVCVCICGREGDDARSAEKGQAVEETAESSGALAWTGAGWGSHACIRCRVGVSAAQSATYSAHIIQKEEEEEGSQHTCLFSPCSLIFFFGHVAKERRSNY